MMNGETDKGLVKGTHGVCRRHRSAEEVLALVRYIHYLRNYASEDLDSIWVREHIPKHLRHVSCASRRKERA